MSKDTMKQRAKGKANEIVGEGRERIGRAIGDEEMEAKGHEQEAKGKLQGKLADVRDAAGDLADAGRKIAR